MAGSFSTPLPFIPFSFGGGTTPPVIPVPRPVVGNRNLVSQLNIRREIGVIRLMSPATAVALAAIQDNANSVDDRLRRLSSSLNSVGLSRDPAGNVVVQGATFSVHLPLQTFAMAGRGSIIGLSPTAPTDDSLPNSSIGLWVGELSDTLTFRVRYSDGTLKTATLPLT